MHGSVATAEDSELCVHFGAAFFVRALADQERDHSRPELCGQRMEIHSHLHLKIGWVLIEADDQRMHLTDPRPEHIGEQWPTVFGGAPTAIPFAHATPANA